MTESLLKNKNPPPCILPQEGWPKLPAHLLCPLLLLHLDISQSYNVQYAATKKERQCYGNVWGSHHQCSHLRLRHYDGILQWFLDIVLRSLIEKSKISRAPTLRHSLAITHPVYMTGGGGEGRSIALSSRHPGCSTSTRNFFSEKEVFHLIILR